MEELLEDNLDMVFEEKDKGDYNYIITAEFDHAIDLLKNNKACGVNEIPAKLLIYIEMNIRNELYKISNEI